MLPIGNATNCAIYNERNFIKGKIRNYNYSNKKNDAITVNLALNYGSKEEIVDACRKFVFAKNNKINIKNFQKNFILKVYQTPIS